MIAAMAAMLGPFAVAIPLAPSHVTLPWLVAPILAGIALPFPVAAWVLEIAALGRVVLDGGRLHWTFRDASGQIDLTAPFAVTAFVDDAADEVAWVILEVRQGDARLAVAYTVRREHAPALPKRPVEHPTFVIASWRAGAAWRQLEEALLALPSANRNWVSG